MSRHSRIIANLEQLQAASVVGGYVRDTDHENRAKWIVSANKVDVHYFTTPEVEAFIVGAQTAIKRELGLSAH